MKVMFDTNIFDSIIKNEIDISALQGKVEICSTHIQYDELAQTPDEVHRNKLIFLFCKISQKQATESANWEESNWDEAHWGGRVISLESSAYGVSRYGMSKYGGSELSIAIWKELQEKKKKKNNSKDALIAETAMVNGLTLITHDNDLSKVSAKLGASVMTLKELFSSVCIKQNSP